MDSTEQHPSPVYDLIANVIHESVAGTTRDKENTVWKVQLRAGSGTGENEKWFQIQDLIVEEIRKEMIFLGETVIQVLISPCDCGAGANHSLLDLGTPATDSGGLRVGSMQTMHLQWMFAVSRRMDCQYGTIVNNW